MFGYIPDKEDKRDAQYELIFGISNNDIPEEFTWENEFYFPKPPNQGSQNICVPAAASFVQMFNTNKELFKTGKLTKEDFDPLFIWDNLDIKYPQGSTLRENGKTLKKLGVCEKNNKFKKEGQWTMSAYNNALKHKIKNFVYVKNPNNKLNLFKIIMEKPVIIGVAVDLNNWNKDDIIRPGMTDFGHSVVAIGWDRNRNIRIANWWGEEWGEKGLGWLSYDYPIIQAMTFIDLPDNWQERQKRSLNFWKKLYRLLFS